MNNHELNVLSPSSGERWQSVEQIAFHLGVSKETIYRWSEKQKIPSHKVGRQWKFKISEVDSWVVSGGAADFKASSMEINGTHETVKGMD